jgi:hypothetical protein
MTEHYTRIKLLLTHRLQSMKDEATVRRRFTLKQQVEELEHLIRMMERELGIEGRTNTITNSESSSQNGDSV